MDSAYNLEVSSPDLDRPLSNDRYLEIYRGHELEFTFYGSFEGNKILQGDLMDFDDRAYRVLIRQLDPSKRKEKRKKTGDLVGQEVFLDRDQVASIKVVLEF